MSHQLVKLCRNALFSVRRRMLKNRRRDLLAVGAVMPIQALEIFIPPVVQQFLDFGEIQELDQRRDAHRRVNRLRDNRCGVGR